MVEQKYPKKERLRSRKDFIEIFNKGNKTYSSHLILFCKGNGGECARVGITASRKVGTAVVRNRVKRLIREFYRQHKSCFAAGYDYSIVVRAGFIRLSRVVADKQLADILRKGNRRLNQC